MKKYIPLFFSLIILLSACATAPLLPTDETVVINGVTFRKYPIKGYYNYAEAEKLLAGTGWRLPKKDELKKLSTRKDLSWDPLCNYWTSEFYSEGGFTITTINLDSGAVVSNKKKEPAGVWPVRDPTAP